MWIGMARLLKSEIWRKNLGAVGCFPHVSRLSFQEEVVELFPKLAEDGLKLTSARTTESVVAKLRSGRASKERALILSNIGFALTGLAVLASLDRHQAGHPTDDPVLHR